MGPAKHVRAMVQWTVTNYEKLHTVGDQSVYATYWLEHPELVTLDYETKLIFCLHDVAASALSVQEGHGIVKNNVFNLGHPQCFMHGNGFGKGLARQLAHDLGPRVTSSFLSPRAAANKSGKVAAPFASMTETLSAQRTPMLASLLWHGVPASKHTSLSTGS